MGSDAGSELLGLGSGVGDADIELGAGLVERLAVGEALGEELCCGIACWARPPDNHTPKAIKVTKTPETIPIHFFRTRKD